MDIVHYVFQQFFDFLIGAGMTLFMLVMILLMVALINSKKP